MVVCLDAFQYSTSKGLRRNMFFSFPFCLFLCHVLFEGSKCFLHKTLAYLPQFDREDLD